MNDVITLINAIDRQVAKVRTQGLDLSFNELLDMYKSEELDISPAYQRLFQWSESTRSRFIESLLLEMPVPPIYVIEDNEGKYLLIDGLQRISSYLHLRGELEAPKIEPPVKYGEKLVLSDCDIVPELNGRTFDDLGTAQQIRLKRTFIRVWVVRKGSDRLFRYHMFKRLNTGGDLLTDQQLRNCTIRMLDPKFNDFIIQLSKEEVFCQCTTENLSNTQYLGAYDQELVLRFFAFKNNRDGFKHDVRDFLTEYMEKVADPDNDTFFDYSREEKIFKKTFDILNTALGEHAFRRANKNRTDLTKSFSVYHFEAFTLGLQFCIDRINVDDPPQMEKLRIQLREIKLNEEFIKLTAGGGKNSTDSLKKRIEFVERKLKALL